MAFQFNKHFRSNARLTYLSNFRFGHLEFDNLSCAWEEHDYIEENEYYPKFPVLIQNDGLPWDIANSYLIGLLEQKHPWEMESINTRAKGLLAYLRFLEDSNLSFLDLPKNNRRKAPYRFRSKLNELIYEGLSVSYASNCMRAVVDFYRCIVKYKLIDESLLKNSPYECIESSVRYMSMEGFSRIKRVQSADISISTSRTQTPIDRIKDGGLLRPLSPDEQKLLKTFIEGPGSNIVLSLMIKIAITTGARLQTICTIRNYHIDYLYSELENNKRSDSPNTRVELNTGQFRDIDTKNGTVHRLFFHKHLIEQLYTYSISVHHKNRMANSYYGDDRKNYLFLTRDGNPFYTSKREILERQDKDLSDNNPKLIVKAGGAVDKLFRNLVDSMQEKHPEIKKFRFHDLRATFGMNLVRYLSASGLSGIKLLVKVRDRMGHNDISITQRYLDFDDMLNEMETTTAIYETSLFGKF